jgi:hypothetical protein
VTNHVTACPSGVATATGFGHRTPEARFFFEFDWAVQIKQKG